MHRPNLNNLSPNERTLLANLIQLYTTPNIIDIHGNAVSSGIHSDPALFLSFHRNYIGGLETFLLQQGYPQWVPLPAWNPVEQIPQEFNIPNTGPERLQNLNPNVSFSPEFDQENLINFATVEELGEALIPRHNLVHRRIGGVMNNMRRAPVAPIFWPFHSFIDDIWWDWQRITVVVPSCIGLSIVNATRLLDNCGLHIDMKANFYTSPWIRIKQQKPAPLTVTPRGTIVKLYY
ncbi:tyrosinase family protein [Desulfolucanica intricata]|uniref:tyrosinase family protein n=1 Tax=Desulfolucanica intricata TaxID=1285191 RepID=UPI00082DFA44|nr:tyrosinase family protein [Desulfolucanica intricata]